jgi:hypothetical protein
MIPVALLGSAVYMVREACAQVENAFRIRADLTYFATLQLDLLGFTAAADTPIT